jgi:tRNA threonylcarbamoyladenosine biosynthesis protein TsaB
MLSMKILAIETATSWQSVALTEDEQVLALVEQDAEGSHARSLMPAIDSLLKKTGIGLHDLKGLAVSIGPGSFTGLRVGLATMLGFRAVLGIPLALVPTLEAMACQHTDRRGMVMPVLRSRKNEVYWALYEWLSDGTLKVRSPETVGSPEMLGRTLKDVGPATLCGDGWLTYGDDIRKALGPRATQLLTADRHRPSALSVAKLSLSRFEKRDVAGHSVAPFYVQRTEAEVKYEQSEGVSALERRRKRIALKLGRRAGRRAGGKKTSRRATS